MEKMRLSKFLSTAGVASRRKAEELIAKGVVKVNGKVVREVVPVSSQDLIEVFGKKVTLVEDYYYYAFHKPQLVITSMADEKDRKTVADYFKDLKHRVYPVGRLDYFSSGLLFMTNDGEFANYLMHPKNEIPKTYYVEARGEYSKALFDHLRQGVDIGDYITKEALVENVQKIEGDLFSMHITIEEGKNRQIRRMCEAVGLKVHKLKRVAVGPISLGDLKSGRYRSLTKKELESLGYIRQ